MVTQRERERVKERESERGEVGDGAREAGREGERKNERYLQDRRGEHCCCSVRVDMAMAEIRVQMNF